MSYKPAITDKEKKPTKCICVNTYVNIDIYKYSSGKHLLCLIQKLPKPYTWDNDIIYLQGRLILVGMSLLELGSSLCNFRVAFDKLLIHRWTEHLPKWKSREVKENTNNPTTRFKKTIDLEGKTPRKTQMKTLVLPSNLCLHTSPCCPKPCNDATMNHSNSWRSATRWLASRT